MGYPLGDEAHEGGADAHGGGGGDVREDVGGEEEVDGAVVRVEGWVEAGAHGVVHDHGEAVGAEVDGGAREPAHGLPDGPDVADLLAPSSAATSVVRKSSATLLAPAGRGPPAARSRFQRI